MLTELSHTSSRAHLFQSAIHEPIEVTIIEKPLFYILPSDVWKLIDLDCKDLVNLSKTCRYLNGLISENKFFWKKVTIQEFGKVTTLEDSSIGWKHEFKVRYLQTRKAVRRYSETTYERRIPKTYLGVKIPSKFIKRLKDLERDATSLDYELIINILAKREIDYLQFKQRKEAELQYLIEERIKRKFESALQKQGLPKEAVALCDLSGDRKEEVQKVVEFVKLGAQKRKQDDEIIAHIIKKQKEENLPLSAIFQLCRKLTTIENVDAECANIPKEQSSAKTRTPYRYQDEDSRYYKARVAVDFSGGMFPGGFTTKRVKLKMRDHYKKYLHKRSEPTFEETVEMTKEINEINSNFPDVDEFDFERIFASLSNDEKIDLIREASLQLSNPSAVLDPLLKKLLKQTHPQYCYYILRNMIKKDKASNMSSSESEEEQEKEVTVTKKTKGNNKSKRKSKKSDDDDDYDFEDEDEYYVVSKPAKRLKNKN